MIDQHYNHPSAILWGLGNEIDWPGDFETYDTNAIIHFTGWPARQSSLLFAGLAFKEPPYLELWKKLSRTR
jgi:beta-galactosidase/beta-glucuronidase